MIKLPNLIKKKKPLDYTLYTLIIIVGIVLDQLTKFLTVTLLELYETFPIIEGVIHFTRVHNTGAAFGSMKDARWIFMIVSTVAITAMLAYLYFGHATSRLYEISLAMVISGGIGNMIDRVALGYVIDFIDFRLINFAVFNGADSFVCVGAELLILALILEILEENKSKSGDKK